MATVEIITGNTYAADAAMRELANKISHRTDATIATTYATEAAIKGAPVVTITDGTGVAAKITMVGLEIPGSKDILGLPQNVYTPHIVKVSLRTNVAAPLLYGAILGEIYKLGTKVEFMATTATPTETTLAGAAAGVWVNDPFWPIQNSL